MNRDSDDAALLHPHGHYVGEQQHNCNGCGTLTPRSEMALYGARCASCYHRFCHARQPALLSGMRNQTPAQAEILKAIRTHRQARAHGASEEA